MLKEASAVCKTILRNGFDAYVINASLQEEIYALTKEPCLDIACEADFETLQKLFPNVEESDDSILTAKMVTEEGAIFNFYLISECESSHPDFNLMRVSPHMLKALESKSKEVFKIINGTQTEAVSEEVFEDRSCGCIRLRGVPHKTLQRNYGLAITALRMAANYDLSIEPTTWLAIVRSSHNISDYMPMTVFVQEMRMVAAENLWKFVQLLSDSFLLHAILPEVASLHAIKQQRNKDDNTEITVFEHTIECMKHYPEQNLHHDWIGTVAMLFSDIGKLHTAENYQGRWTFYQYHKVGAQVARSILKRLHFSSDEVDTICALVRNHIRFHSMLTDRGIRRFLSADNTERLIEMTRAHIEASGMPYTNFNHNLKYLERADLPETMLEPLLNGNEIMEVTQLSPGRAIGVLREALLDAQKAGKVKNAEQAIAFVREYKVEEE